MAKLNGVKTLDMVNGEITKVAYNGAEYALTSETAVAGDLILSLENCVDIDHGAFYVCTGGNSRDIYFLDNNGDDRDREQSDYKAFHKISTQTTPVIPSVGDVVTFEGFDGEYRKVDRKAQAGDVVVLTGDNLPEWFTKGNAYEVFPPSDSTDNVSLIADDGDDLHVYYASCGRTPETVDVYEKVEAEYVPQEGDIVVVINNTSGHINNIGDIGKVGSEEPLTDGGVIVRVPNGPTYAIRTKPSDIRKATPAEVAQYEKALHKASFSVGDYVKIVKSYYENEGAIAEIVEIGKYSTDTGYCEFKLKHISGQKVGQETAAAADQLVKATEQEVADASKPKLKAGDYITIDTSEWDNDITEGKAYKVQTDAVGDLCFIDDEGDERYAAIEYGDYEILSAEEVAKHAEAEKWAKIGRKVGEFMLGDIVRVNGGSGHPSGTIGELVSGQHFAYPRKFGVLANGKIYDHTDTGFKLVAPVDALFNA